MGSVEDNLSRRLGYFYLPLQNHYKLGTVESSATQMLKKQRMQPLKTFTKRWNNIHANVSLLDGSLEFQLGSQSSWFDAFNLTQCGWWFISTNLSFMHDWMDFCHWVEAVFYWLDWQGNPFLSSQQSFFGIYWFKITSNNFHNWEMCLRTIYCFSKGFS